MHDGTPPRLLVLKDDADTISLSPVVKIFTEAAIACSRGPSPSLPLTMLP
jgi:hypothetical protein